jgi:hypothetical protein
MPTYIARTSHNFYLEITAADQAKADRIAMSTPIEEWQSSGWDTVDVELESEEDETED